MTVSHRAAARLGWSAFGLTAVLGLLTAVFVALDAGTSTPPQSWGLGGFGGLAFALASLSFAAVGALVASQLPGNAIGWIFCLTGLLIGVGDLAYQYANHALYVAPGSLPAGRAAAWLHRLGLPPAFGMLGLSFVLFPDGRLPSPHWRPAPWMAVLGIACIVSGHALRPGPLDEPFTTVSNPLGIGGAFELLDTLSWVGWPLMAAAIALAAVALTFRLRRSRGDEHQQLKWIAVAAAFVGVVVVAFEASWFVDFRGVGRLRIGVLGLSFTLLPVAAGIAILRHRLYDIDLVISRTLVYGGLSATLAGVYLASVLLLQLALSPLTADSGLAIAGSTLAVAALFRPARARIQTIVDRRFYRRRYDAARILEHFGARLRDEVELNVLSSDLRDTVRETMEPAHVSLWLRPSRAGAT
ncbi:MAG: hypothetical protein H0U12_09025 [Thermoleophilaceae bacterium]|nr:hypothetical protein [Thermoleophilaceae bacterium]